MGSPILRNIRIDQARLDEVIRMSRNVSKSRDYIEAITNPVSAADWELVAHDPKAPFHADLLQYILEGESLEKTLERLERKVAALNHEDAAKREWRIQGLVDSAATHQLIYGDHGHERVQMKPPHVESVFELQAKADILEKSIFALKENITEQQSAITTCKQDLNTIDKQWKYRQADQAAGFVLTLNDQLIKSGADFDIKMKPSIVKRLEKVFITASPAKVLQVNPRLADSPDDNVEVMKQINDFVRELKVLTEINRLIHDPLNKQPEKDFFPRPSQINKLVRQVKVPRLTNEDKKAIEAALVTKKKLKTAQSVMKQALLDIHEKEKHLNQLHDEIRVQQNKLPASHIAKVPKLTKDQS